MSNTYRSLYIVLFKCSFTHVYIYSPRLTSFWESRERPGCTDFVSPAAADDIMSLVTFRCMEIYMADSSRTNCLSIRSTGRLYWCVVHSIVGQSSRSQACKVSQIRPRIDRAREEWVLFKVGFFFLNRRTFLQLLNDTMSRVYFPPKAPAAHPQTV
jgi:hypothetical protein